MNISEECRIREECEHQCIFCGRAWIHRWRDSREIIAWCYLKKVSSCPECLIVIREECYGARKEPSVPGEQQPQYP